MEHIVQFGVTIDDEAIQRHVEKKAAEAVTSGLNRSLFRLGYRGEPVGITEDVKDIIDDFLEKHKQEIIKMAADELFEHLKRTKAVRAAVGDAVRRAEE